MASMSTRISLLLLLCSLLALSSAGTEGEERLRRVVRSVVDLFRDKRDARDAPPYHPVDRECDPIENCGHPGIFYDCSCLIGDVVYPAQECAREYRSFYEFVIERELQLEMDRDNERVRQGQQSDAGPYFQLLACQQQLPQVQATENNTPA